MIPLYQHPCKFASDITPSLLKAHVEDMLYILTICKVLHIPDFLIYLWVDIFYC